MKSRVAALCTCLLLATPATASDLLNIASPQRGSWEGAIPELGKEQGIFQKHGLDLDILYTAGGGETLQAVISGAVDVGLSAGTLGVMGAFAKNAPIRIIGASSTGSRELFWYVRASSALKSLRDAPEGTTIAYSTIGASTHIAVLRFIADYGLKARPVATGDISATTTQAMSGQVDVGWSVAPFNLDPLAKGEIRLVARASDIARIRGQTIRVQIANLGALAQKRDAIARYLAAYRETLDWMYASPEAVARYVAFSKLPESAVRRMLAEFIPKESLQVDRVVGTQESMQDAIQFKFLAAPLSTAQLQELIRIAPSGAQ
ncbi:MAG TPA: ABC transporter substrate-binding protein [Xanthobacteraceae bacterium]|nr:ABC transporter substrate-binding protein [Xanthobacteraceae bacterium]